MNKMDHPAIDWNHEWRRLMERNEALKGLKSHSFWDTMESALKFYESSFEDGGERVNWIISQIPHSPDSRILDVGSGPGTIAIPLFRGVAEVTAVEPSPAMAGVLKEKITEYRIENIGVVEKPWEDVNPVSDLNPPYDTVFASFSLGMHDIWEAIEKMNSVCCGRVVLFHFAGDTAWEWMMRELWPVMHGKEYYPGPRANIIFNLLCSRGIYPDVVSAPNNYRLNYASVDDVVLEFSKRFNAETNEHSAILNDFFEKNMSRNTDTGEFYIDMKSWKMCLSWEAPKEQK